MVKLVGMWVLILLLVLSLLIFAAGQLGLLRGHRPNDLGLHDGLLKPPVKRSWNVVSSHAHLQPHTAYHVIDPLRYSGDGPAAFERLNTLVRARAGVTIVRAEPGYLHAEFETRWLKFVDDVEFVLDQPAGVIQMRSASRLGRKDFQANRQRLESIRQEFNG